MRVAIRLSEADLGTVPLRTARNVIHNLIGEGYQGQVEEIAIESGPRLEVAVDGTTSGRVAVELHLLVEEALADLRLGLSDAGLALAGSATFHLGGEDHARMRPHAVTAGTARPVAEG